MQKKLITMKKIADPSEPAKICLLIKSSTLEDETRRHKEIKSLSDAGYLVRLVSWNRKGKNYSVTYSVPNTMYDEVVLNFPAPPDVRVLVYLPIWWIFLLYYLTFNKWDIAHVINFDSLIPSVFPCKLKRKPVIYEILDTYEDHLILPSWFRKIVITFDKFLMRMVDSIILVDEMQIDELNGIPNTNIHVLYDSPVDSLTDIKSENPKNTKFTIFYAGWFAKARRLNLNKLFQAVVGIDDIEVTIAGFGDTEEIEHAMALTPDKIRFIGKIPHTEVLKRSYESDLLFVLRDPQVLENKYICGSKLFEAMMCATPLLVNNGTSTAEKVQKESCGLVVDANNVEEIREKIIYLKNNPSIGKQLGNNGRIAYESKYSWKIMERRLLDLYSTLVKKSEIPGK
jgi:glycosyltransferase involved in cell wall biosynthesis